MSSNRYNLIVIILLLFSACATTKKSNEDENGRVWGLDISHYQTNINWDRLEVQNPGFIFIKATEGATVRDEKYNEHYKNARKKEILVGSYHFFTYKTSGREQAKNFLGAVTFLHGDLPLVLDAEYSKTMPDKKTVQKELMDFINAVNDKTGCYPIVYCPHKYYTQYLKEILPAKCKLWIVDYKSKPAGNWTFWQTTEKYRVDGIKGYVDFNIFNGNLKQLKKIVI